MKLKFSVLGEPAGKGRPRFRNAGAFVQPYTPEKTVSYENLVKIVCDSLNNIAYHDDAQIVDAQVRKFFSDDPRVVVTIQEAE